MFLLALLLVLAAPASAGTIATGGDCSARYYCTHEATYTAAPGERNDVTVTRPGPGLAQIHDAGAPVRGCLRVDDHTALCGAPASESFTIHVNLGDGGDVAHVVGARVNGGPGNDTLTGEQGVLTGGPGSDVLTSTAGGVWFEDGDGSEPAPDRYVGAPGSRNEIDYIGRYEDLRIDLRGPYTTPEGDYLENIQNAHGGYGDDVIIGNDGPNKLYGARGADRVVGLGGDDELYTDIDGGALVQADPPGRDVLEGGAGDDELYNNSRHTTGSVYGCGPGRDYVSQTQRRDFVRGDCERLAIGPGVHYQVRLHVRRLRFLTDPDSGAIVVRAGRHVVARGRHRVVLNALGRQLLARRGRLRIAVDVRDGDDGGGFRTELRR